MTTFTKRGRDVWRDYETDGVPGSGLHEPRKTDIRTWANEVEGQISSVLPGFQFTWTTAVSGAPAAGVIGANNATLSSATALRVSTTGAQSQSYAAALTAQLISTSPIKARVVINTPSDATQWMMADVTAVADVTGYKTFTISNVSGSAPSNGATVVMQLVPSDAGTVAAQAAAAAASATAAAASATSASTSAGTANTAAASATATAAGFGSVSAFQEYSANDGFRHLATILSNPFLSLFCVGVGDSNFWGSGVTRGPSDIDPNTITNSGYLKSGARVTPDTNVPRSFLNRLRDAWGKGYADNQNISNPSQGEYQYSSDVHVSVADPNITVVAWPSPGSALTKTVVTQANAFGNRYIDLAAGQALKFQTNGGTFDVVYTTQASTGRQLSRFFSDVSLATAQATLDPYGAVATWQQTWPCAIFDSGHAASSPNGIRTVYLANTGTGSVRIEGIIFKRRIALMNCGCPGTWSGQWKSDSSGNCDLSYAIPARTNLVLYSLGTNDTVRAVNDSVNDSYINMLAHIDWIIANRPGAKIILLTPPARTGAGDYYVDPTTYSFPVSQIQTVLMRIARERKLAVLDQFTLFRQAIDAGVSWSNDGTHLNDNGAKLLLDEFLRRQLGAASPQ